jgi:hypothetical protein
VGGFIDNIAMNGMAWNRGSQFWPECNGYE